MALGEMYYSSHYGGWIYPAEHRAVSPLLRAEHKAPLTWSFCPFCGGPLPDEVSAVERIIDQGDGSEA